MADTGKKIAINTETLRLKIQEVEKDLRLFFEKLDPLSPIYFPFCLEEFRESFQTKHGRISPVEIVLAVNNLARQKLFVIDDESPWSIRFEVMQKVKDGPYFLVPVVKFWFRDAQTKSED